MHKSAQHKRMVLRICDRRLPRSGGTGSTVQTHSVKTSFLTVGVATPHACAGCTADGVILQGAVGKEYATGRALASRLNNSEWDVTAQQAVEVFSCARIWFVGENIFRSLFFATTNVLNEPFSEGAYMTPRSMYFKWSYTSISVFKQKAKR